MNAIIFKNCVDLKGCTLYTTLFPCHECVKVIIQSGIKEIYYLMDDQDVSEGKKPLLWDHPSLDTDWQQQKKKATNVASRCLLKKSYTSSTQLPQTTSQLAPGSTDKG